MQEIKNNFPKVLIYKSEEVFQNEPKGGPNAVCYNYYKEMNRRGERTLFFLPSQEQQIKISTAKGIVRSLPNWFVKIERDIRNRNNIVRFLNNEPKPLNINFQDYDIIHFHSTLDLYNAKNSLSNFNGLIILQSHSPQLLSQEVYEKVGWIARHTIRNFSQRFKKVDEYAFERADYLLFPCEDAMEPYYNNWPEFDNLINKKHKNIKYILTGIPPIRPQREKKVVLDELNIPLNDFVISYVGRHNRVKGFDLLKDISSRFFQMRNNSWVISAGKEWPITRLEHSNWKEIGWTTDAYSYINASDVFILPNRETYFDLVMIEVLSLGKIVLASNTGGNKYFAKCGLEGVFLYETVDEAVRKLCMIADMTPIERKRLGEKNREFYEKKLSVSSMYDNYIKVLQEVYNEKI